MEDLTSYGASDFVREDDVVIPNRSINDPFLNKLCNGTFISDFSDKSDASECSQPSGMKLDNDENVNKQFKLVDGIIYLEFDTKLPWNEMKPTLGLRRNDYRSLMIMWGRDLAEGRSGGKKGKKEDWASKKGKAEGESPTSSHANKGKKGSYIRSPAKKGVQGDSSAEKGPSKGVEVGGQTGVDESRIDQDGGVDLTGVGPSDVDRVGVGPSYARDTSFMYEDQNDETVTENPIEEFKGGDIPTQ
ncbi:hypothetical protein Tco_0866366 [Tanacetum coccineum]